MQDKEMMDKAWKDMELLLDKEMPKKRRGAFWFWFCGLALVVVLASVTFYLWSDYSNNSLNTEQIRDTQDVALEQKARVEDMQANEPISAPETSESQENPLSVDASLNKDNDNPRSSVPISHTGNSKDHSEGLTKRSDIQYVAKVTATSNTSVIADDYTVNPATAAHESSNTGSEDQEESEVDLILDHTTKSNQLAKGIQEDDEEVNAQSTKADLSYASSNIQSLAYTGIPNSNSSLLPVLTRVSSESNWRTDYLISSSVVSYADANNVGLKIGVGMDIYNSLQPHQCYVGLSTDVFPRTVIPTGKDLFQGDIEQSKDGKDGTGSSTEYNRNRDRVVIHRKYIDLALMYQYRFRRFKVGIGTEFSYLYTQNSLKTPVISNNPILNAGDFNIILPRFQMGLIQSLSYRIHPHYSVGLMSRFILTEMPKYRKLNNHYIKLDLNYYF